MKSHICLNEHEIRNYFEKVIIYRTLVWNFFQYISGLRKTKQMRKIMYNLTLFIWQNQKNKTNKKKQKRQTLTISAGWGGGGGGGAVAGWYDGVD